MSKNVIVKFLISFGVLLLLISGVMYWRGVYTSPAKVFDRMLATSLSTAAVTKTITQVDDSQRLKQTTLLETEPKALVHSLSVLEQAGEGETVVTTETIATPETDYVRYSEIRTKQTNMEGKPFDFANVVGVWGRSSQDDPRGDGPQQLNQALLGVVPFANMNKQQRGQLLELIRKESVYNVDMNKVKRQTKNFRPIYSYEVSVKPVAYVRMLKTFAQANGLAQLDQVDPEQYAESASLSFVFDVDVWSGQLTNIAYQNGGRMEAYSGYGARIAITPPSKTIPVDELQTRLQSIR